MSIDILFAFGVGWGLGMAFTFRLSSILWPDHQNVWDKHKEVQARVKEMSKRKI